MTAAGKKIKKIYRILDHKSIGNPLVFFLMLLILPITVLGVQQTVKYLSRAAGTAEVAFSPTTISLPPDAAVKINVNGNGSAVAFARVVFTFDKTKVKLAGEITPSATLSTVVEKSTMAAANSSGQAVIVLAASPSDTRPTGNFELASFNISALSANPASTLQFVTANMQIVEGGGSKMTINPVNAQINGAGGPVPTNTPGSAPPTNPPVPGSVSFAFNPAAGSLPPNSTFKIMLNAGSKKIVFGRTVVTFDQSKVNLASEITPNPALATVVEKTTMAAANGSGRAVIVLAASPASSLPTGIFEFAALNFTAKTTSPGSVTVNFDSNDMQVVDDSTIPLSFSVTPLVLGLNGASPPPGGGPGGGGGNPQACQNRGSVECYNQWKQEYLGTLTTKIADLNSDGIVDLGDFEFWRRAAYP